MRSLALEGLAVTLIVSALALTPAPARAGGMEYAGAGAQALGRGGAVAARADDPMVLSYNPAGLAELQGSQIMMDLNLALMKACVDPIGYYGWGVYQGGRPIRLTDYKTGKETVVNLGKFTDGKLDSAAQAYYVDPYDRVCMNQNLQPVPQFVVTKRISEKLGVGFGLIFPGVLPQGRWGDGNGVIHGKNGVLRPAATRYMMMDSNLLGVFPTLGAGYRITRWLRIGAEFDWGLILVNNTVMAATSGGAFPNGDIITELQAKDLFVPGFTGSLHLVPVDALDIVAAFRYQDALDAKGAVDLTTGVFDPEGKRRTTPIHVLSVHQNMPWKLRFGIRYAQRLNPRPTDIGEGPVAPKVTVHDPLQDERWDAEIDAEYQFNSRNQEQVITYRQNQILYGETLDGVVSQAQFPSTEQPPTTIQKRWRDQISLRAGGSYNILPGKFSVSLGAHYENRGVNPDYMQIDFWPVGRLGLHAGVKFRIFGYTDLVFSYAHIFQETIVVGAAPQEAAHDIYVRYQADPAQGVTTIDKTVGAPATRGETLPPKYEKNPPSNPDGTARLNEIVTKFATDQPPWIINAGTYRSHLDILAVGVNVHF